MMKQMKPREAKKAVELQQQNPPCPGSKNHGEKRKRRQKKLEAKEATEAVGVAFSGYDSNPPTKHKAEEFLSREAKEAKRGALEAFSDYDSKRPIMKQADEEISITKKSRSHHCSPCYCNSEWPLVKCAGLIRAPPRYSIPEENDIINIQALLFTEKRDYLLKNNGQKVNLISISNHNFMHLYVYFRT